MIISSSPIPFEDRHLQTNSGFSLIWPFLNVPRGAGPYELLLDNNAANNVSWLSELPRELSNAGLTINLWPAMMEQWISNPVFREDPAQQIRKRYLEPLAASGFSFDVGFAKRQVELLTAAHRHLLSHLSILFPYIAIAKQLTRLKPKASALQRLREIAVANIPRFTGCNMLIALTLVLRDQGKQNMPLNVGGSPAYPLLEAFFANQPKRKNEPADHMDIAYLRNRSGDLTLWYTPSFLMQHGYQPKGELVLVTRDKALREVIFRALPPYLHESGGAAFALDQFALPDDVTNPIRAVLPTSISPPRTMNEMIEKITELYQLATSLCYDQREKDALTQAWAEWCQPALGIDIGFVATSRDSDRD